MSRPFIEEQISIIIDYGSSFGQQYDVLNQVTAGGNDYGFLKNPYPKMSYNLKYGLNEQAWTTEQIIDLYHRSFGTFGGFRVRDLADFSTNNYVDAPTATDQQCIFVSGVIWQIVRWYGIQGDLTQSRRLIRKPENGTVLVAIAGFPTTRFSADTTTGQITFIDNTRNINGITLGVTTQIDFTANHNLVAGESVLLSSITGTVELNDNRYEILSIVDPDSIEVDVDSSLFTAYVSDGVSNTDPLSTEVVTAGCLYSIPCRFETEIDDAVFSRFNILEVDVNVVELLNP